MPDEARVRWLPVREVGEVRMGKQLSPSSRDAAEQFPYLRVANVLLGCIDYTDVKTMSFTSAEREVYGLKPGDVLLNEGQSLELVGRSAIYEGNEGEFCFQNTLIRFRPGSQLLSQYAQVVFERWLATGVFSSIAKQTTSIAHLGGDRFSALPFPLLPLSEQQRIVEVIDAVSAQERAIEASITKLTALRSAALENLLGEFPWDGSLDDVIAGPIRNGFSPVEWDSWTGIQLLGLGCLTSLGFDPVQLKNAPPVVRADHPAMLADGDVLMSRANTRELIGLAGVYRDIGNPCIYPDLMMRIRPSKKFSSEFLAAVLMSDRVRRYVRAMAQGTSESMVKISAKLVRRIPIPLSSPREQWRVEEVLDVFSRQLQAEKEELAKLRALKWGVIERLLLC